MKKRLLLISYNFYPEPTGIGKYNGEMISWFVSRKDMIALLLRLILIIRIGKFKSLTIKRDFGTTVEESVDSKSGGSLSSLQMSSICSR